MENKVETEKWVDMVWFIFIRQAFGYWNSSTEKVARKPGVLKHSMKKFSKN